MNPGFYQTTFDADGDNTAQQATSDPTKLFGVIVANKNAEQGFLQLFDALAANVTVGTTTPKLSIPIPSGDGTLYGSFDQLFPDGIKFDVGICYACTQEPTGNTDPTVGLTVNLLHR